MTALHTSSSLARTGHTLTASASPQVPAEKTTFNRMEKPGLEFDAKRHAAINCLCPDGRAMTCHTIPLPAVELAAMSAKLRRRTQGRTALLAAFTPRLAVDLDCHRGAPPSHRTVERAMQEGMRVDQAGPIGRGYIADLVKRIRALHGASEVRKTFGAGLKELVAEHRFFLRAGKKEVNHGL